MFGEIVADLDYPMLMVTVAAGEEMAGCLLGFASQCSIDLFHGAREIDPGHEA